MLEQILQADRWFFKLINSGLANPVFDWVCPYIRTQEIWYPVYALLIFFLIKQYKKQSWLIIVTAAVMIACTDQFSANLIKGLFMRTRPCLEPLLQGQVRHLIESCRGYSFISAHATNHFALAVFMSYYFKAYGKWVQPLLLFWAFSIAFSQVYVGVHYPADVIVGGLVGWLFGAAFGKYLLKFVAINRA